MSAPAAPNDDPRGDTALLQAVTRAVATNGYRATSVADVLDQAGVARSTFYARYPNKERCFTDAVGAIVRETLEAVQAAIPDLGAPRELIEPPLATLLEAAAAQPEAARAVLVESHAAGDDANAHRRAAQELLARLMSRALAPRKRATPAAEALAAGVSGGIELLLARAAQDGRTAELPPLAPAIAAWAAGHSALLADLDALPAAPTRPPSRRRGQAPGSLVPVGPSGRRGLPPGPKRMPREAIAQTVRDRLLDATVAVAADRGVDALTVAAIVAHAETSRRSFYEHFAAIDEAFATAMRLGAEAAAAATLTAYAARRDPAVGIAAACDRLATFLAEEATFTRAALIAAPAAGARALAARAEAVDALAGVVADAHRRLGREADDGDLVADLSAGAALALCAEHLRAEDPSTLPALAPLLAAVALAPAADPPAIVAAIDEALATG